VYTNTDLTEGRGREYPTHVCESWATAHRLGKGGYVQGTNCPVQKHACFQIGGQWFGPVHINAPTKEDDAVQARHDARHKAIKKAYDAGLTDDDLKALGAAQ
jgi:hypothetical protein